MTSTTSPAPQSAHPRPALHPAPALRGGGSISETTTVVELGQYLSAKEATFSAGYSSGLWHFAVSMGGRMVIGEGADLVTAIGRALEKVTR